MNKFLNSLEIKNFKSIKNIKTDCKRVNVFLGKPNVGKSNILEAISLLGAHYCRNADKLLSEFIRYEEISNLFYDDDLSNLIEVNTDKANALMRFHSSNINQADLFIGSKHSIESVMDLAAQNINDIRRSVSGFNHSLEQKQIIEYIDLYYASMRPNGQAGGGISDLIPSTKNPIKKYQFKEGKMGTNKFPYYLLPPYGDNLFAIVDHNKELRKEITDIFEEYGLKFVGYKKESTFEIEKNTDGYVNKYHYSSIADTFQRLVFYYAAIDSNKDSVIILEEPEVHSFPPYTKELSERIIDSKTNQFFITTHSPYLIQNLISNLEATELNVFITYFENYQTKIKELSADELRKVSEFSVDIFFNLNEFVKNA
jgi:AAA15 family ATPase/GTPase